MLSHAPDLSLALQYHQSGQLGAAADLYQAILAENPQNADARHLLGVVAMQNGNYDLAVNHILRAIRQQGGVATYHSNLGVAYRSMKKLDEAVASFRRAVKLAPKQADAYNNLAAALSEQGNLHEAIALWRRAVAVQPNYVDAWSNLATALRQAGRIDEFIDCLRKIQRLQPHRADHCNNLGTALHKQGNLDEAIVFYRRAIACDPSFALPHNNLGNALQEQEKLLDACESYCRAIALKPDFAQAYVGLASTRYEQGFSDEAIQHYLTAIQLKPDLAEAQCNLGIVLEEQGDFPAAESHFRAAITSDFRYAAAHSELAGLLRGRLPDTDRTAAEQLLLDSSLSQEPRAALHFGLAQVCDARGAYAEAAEHASVANSLRVTQWRIAGQEYDVEGHSRFVDNIIAEFTPEFFARVGGFGLETERPVFVIGLPRSGTTLIEQILASHSQVFGAGELALARDEFAEACRPENRAGMQLSGLDGPGIGRLAARHAGELNRRNATALRVIDKMPDNYLYVGFLAVLFPRARFIHCRRDVRDVAVSCWLANFRSVRWASNIGHLAARFRDYGRLMEHWQEVLPAPILDISYEETVSDLETAARRLVDWCGLPWEPACLEFHRRKGVVRTASTVQVRQPLYTSSVGRWRHYEKSLAALISAVAK